MNKSEIISHIDELRERRRRQFDDYQLTDRELKIYHDMLCRILAAEDADGAD